MDSTIFQKYRNVISQFNPDDGDIDRRLEMDRDGPVSVHYAPFDFINTSARVVIVGITPGRTQMINSLKETRTRLAAGDSAEEACRAVKKAASFSGPMRPNLINLLDHIGLHRWLGIASTSELFSTAAGLVQTTSVLRYPVFVNGENYNGSPDMTKHTMLCRYLVDHFGSEAAQLKKAVFIPLGDKVTQALQFLSKRGIVDERRILSGLPHPSGANAERISYFLGTKDKALLSRKTDPVRLDLAKKMLNQQLLQLAAATG
jgi:hypothetical protein